MAILKPKQPFDDFAVQELKSLLLTAGIDPVEAFAEEFEARGRKLDAATQYAHIGPADLEREYFARLRIRQSDVPLLQKVVDRSVMVRTFVKLIAHDKNTDELVKNMDPELIREDAESLQTFYFYVTATFKSLKRDEQVKEMEKFSQYPWKGKACIKEPDRVFWLIQNWKFVEKDGSSFYDQVFFGKEIVKSNFDNKTFNAKYTLKNRLYLGPTSTDHELAFLMANQARIKEGDFVLDPFVGTGSILISAAHFNAVCYGTEIDYRVIRGKGVGRKNPQCDVAHLHENVWIFSNFEQYKFAKPEILRMDCTNDLLKYQTVFDAIICDPPYGLRASARESGLRPARIKRKEEKGDHTATQTGAETEKPTEEEISEKTDSTQDTPAEKSSYVD